MRLSRLASSDVKLGHLPWQSLAYGEKSHMIYNNLPQPENHDSQGLHFRLKIISTTKLTFCHLYMLIFFNFLYNFKSFQVTGSKEGSLFISNWVFLISSLKE